VVNVVIQSKAFGIIARIKSAVLKRSREIDRNSKCSRFEKVTFSKWIEVERNACGQEFFGGYNVFAVNGPVTEFGWFV
jgi:hypothetical protein